MLLDMNKPIVYRRTLVTQAYHSLSLKRLFSLFSITSTAFIASGCQSIAPGYSESSVLIENTYSRAKEFTAEQLRDKAHNLWLDANWLEDNQSEFWFERYSVKNGQEFVLVNPQDQQMRALFDPSVLSKALLTSDLIESSINWKDSPMHSVVYTKGDIAFSINEQLFKCSLERDNYKCISNDDKDSKKVLSQEQYTSPNGASYVRVVDYNLQLCSVESNACQQLTQDGTELTPYAVKHPYPESSLADAEFDPQKHLDIAWSADSRYLISYKLFREGVSKLTLTDSVKKRF